ncbi:hypothetical protein FHX10_003397 [Rhizobium sp. BK591]|uniref:hypothetical protein n=1 Tax=Rhizobium sp. BK591 TaxID=2586985 RepID=UPI001607E385|nr:hypothetical protein [Rhizobium sp. BK591]MBB3743898.1 hypothetical protein [Rhizobium sp. BK591]
MPSHLQDFAHDLVARHGPRTAGMILQAFTNVGNLVPGASVPEQIAAVEAELKADDRLSYDDSNPGRGGGWFSHKEHGGEEG